MNIFQSPAACPYTLCEYVHDVNIVTRILSDPRDYRRDITDTADGFIDSFWTGPGWNSVTRSHGCCAKSEEQIYCIR